MIPHKLQMSNFLSYGSEPEVIDFTPYHLIYLSGKNGHGKSAMLDAITWAIWGQARKVSTAVKADQGLLRLGQTQMIVILDFELGGQLYRVRREFTCAYGKMTTTLEFGLLNPKNNELIPLTDKTIRATQEKIEKTIRLDYEAFVNSAFLRQGHANEFSQKSPKERKEILGTILGLQQFDTIKKRALEKSREAITQQQTLKGISDKIQEQLAQKDELEKIHVTVKNDITHIQKEEKIYLEKKSALEKQRGYLAEQNKQFELIKLTAAQQRTEQNKQQEILRKELRAWRTIQAKQRTLPQAKELEKQHAESAQTVAQYQKKLQDILQIKEDSLQKKELLQNRALMVQKKYAAQAHEQKILFEKNKFEREAIQKNLEDNTKQQNTLSALLKNAPSSEQLKKLHEQFEKRKNAYQQFIAQGKWLNAERESLTQKTSLVHDDDPSCPLCEQNLSIARRKFLKTKFVKQQHFIEHRIARLYKLVKKLKEIVIAQHAELEQFRQHEQQSKELAALKKSAEQLVKKEVELNRQLLECDKKLKEATLQEQDAVKKDPEIILLQKELEALEQKNKDLNYNQVEHKKIQHEHDALEKQLQAYRQLQADIERQHERTETIHALIEQLKKIKQELNALNKKLEPFATLAQSEEALKNQENDLQAQQAELLKKKEALLQQLGSIQTQQEQLKKMEKESKEHQKKIEELYQTIEDYQIIASATGKDGIQALLIEEAIPEIEQEANSLLSKLTNNQSQIFIESLRDLKKGGSKETLEIKISDASGIRPYELFSGGEAFRIDFALRIAISKLLARRAGTALQTLIIDEGFGSQDEEGLSLIMDAIHKIQDDFEKVIVVSHLPDMKEQFPVHFVVEKRATGSHITIAEQG